MSSPKVFLHSGYKKKDGTCAIYILVHIENKSLKFPTGLTVDPLKFDHQKSRIKGASKEIKDKNMIIDKSLALINDIEVRYRLQQKELTADLLKREWINPSRRIDFYAFFDEAIKERKGDIAESTIRQHKSAIEKLKKFKPKLTFSEIDQEFIESYRRWLKAAPQNNDINTIHTALKNFKTYVSIAKRKGVIEVSPFNQYSIKSAKTDRTFLNEQELESVWNLYSRNYCTGSDQLILRHFLFMCFTGLRISDFKALTADSIISDILVYNPIKTRNSNKITVKVPLNSYALRLISDEGSKTKKLFNHLSEQKMNERIKEIVKVVKIRKEISNHCARHTFATIWINKTKDVAGLQKMLGHSDISMTMIYVHITDQMVNEQMQNFDSSMFRKNIPQIDPRDKLIAELKAELEELKKQFNFIPTKNPATTREAGVKWIKKITHQNQ